MKEKSFLGSFFFPISDILPGKQQLRSNHNLRGMKKDELLEHNPFIKTVI